MGGLPQGMPIGFINKPDNCHAGQSEQLFNPIDETACNFSFRLLSFPVELQNLNETK
jgi:hypothetical protein